MIVRIAETKLRITDVVKNMIVRIAETKLWITDVVIWLRFDDLILT